MAREGGRYIKEKNGELKLVQRTEPAKLEQSKGEEKAAPKVTPEVGNNEDA